MFYCLLKGGSSYILSHAPLSPLILPLPSISDRQVSDPPPPDPSRPLTPASRYEGGSGYFFSRGALLRLQSPGPVVSLRWDKALATWVPSAPPQVRGRRAGYQIRGVGECKVCMHGSPGPLSPHESPPPPGGSVTSFSPTTQGVSHYGLTPRHPPPHLLCLHSVAGWASWHPAPCSAAMVFYQGSPSPPHLLCLYRVDGLASLPPSPS